MTATVEFYFDPISPYAWLASEQLDNIENAGGQIVCRPVLLAALLNACGTKGPAEVPAKRAYTFRDVMREAKMLGLPFCGPPTHPFNPLAALRVIHAVEGSARQLKLTRHLLAAIWREGVDVSDVSVLRQVITSGGFDPNHLLSAAVTEEVKLRLRSATQEAVDLDIFGVPTFRMHNELFWGADRVDAVVWSLRGGTIDKALYEKALARPASANR